MTETVGQAVRAAAKDLADAGVASPRLEAELLLARATGWPRPVVLIDGDRPVPDEAWERFEELVSRRCRREPLQQILGDTEFFGLRIVVDENVMAPRPETEALVEQVIKNWRPGFRSVLDIGTGSGCIAVALASNIPECSVDALDISEKALATAGRNVELHGLSDRVKLFRGDLFPDNGKAYDAVVSNPPYIPSGEIEGLMPEVTRYEPRLALDGGPDGLEYYEKIVTGSIPRIRPGGLLALEAGDGQAAGISSILAGAGGWSGIETAKDLAGVERVVMAWREPRQAASP